MTDHLARDDPAAGASTIRRPVLAIDTCFQSCSAAVGLFAGHELIRTVARFEPMQTGQAERIVGMVGDVVTEAGVAMADVGLVAVTVGPGSFTGTRIGIAAAKGLGLALGVPTAGVTSLQVIAVQLAKAGAADGREMCVAIDMGRHDIYVQVFDETGFEARIPARLIRSGEIDDFAAAHAAVVLGHGPCFSAQATPLSQYFLPHAETVVALVTQCRRKLTPAVALYLRAPDAKPPGSGVGRT
ncbi:MAG: tRNA (adenosine(37)-N6)-threonylcarbamoyltransferase complex dimerization subunit type 1 TsaB [Hyphomicrobium aestuarii]|nr:tRNA (adenosine(37)-N6)-threonylcarbamoyltransferase complex dimerization subunit type 1 TsaB [Hyphomicrobium aestuarii]